MGWLARWLALLGLAVSLAGSVAAQGSGEHPILVIDPERLFDETLFGRRFQKEFETRGKELAAENRRLEAELTAEERDLTEKRPTLSVEEFRRLADAFNAKVEQVRTEQDAKTVSLQRLRESEQQRFFGQIGPVLSKIVSERGAQILMDKRSVIIALDQVDITLDAVALIDAEVGDGGPAPDPEPAK